MDKDPNTPMRGIPMPGRLVTPGIPMPGRQVPGVTTSTPARTSTIPLVMSLDDSDESDDEEEGVEVVEDSDNEADPLAVDEDGGEEGGEESGDEGEVNNEEEDKDDDDDEEGDGEEDSAEDEEGEEESGEDEEGEEDEDDEDGEGEEDSDEDGEGEEEEDENAEEGGEEDKKVKGEVKRKTIMPQLTLKKLPISKKLVSTAASSPASSDSGAPTKKRGRPTKAEMERRAKEQAEKEARGEVEEEDTGPKKRGRKPMDPELKKKLQTERLQAKKVEKVKVKSDKKKAREEKKAAAQSRREERLKRKDKEDKESKERRKPGRKGRMLTDEEKEQREVVRKSKYEELKRIKAEKQQKRHERNEELKEKRKQKKEEERRQREAYEKRMQELKASLLDETTQMSATGGEAGEITAILDETSQTSQSMTKTNYEMSNLDLVKDVTAETLFEYQWPPLKKNSEYYFLQEQVSEFLNIKSIKRRYPNLERRKIKHDERDFLLEMRVINETQADLGLFAIPSADVLDIMSRDHYEKYEEYHSVMSERKNRQLSTNRTTYSTAVKVESHQLANFIEKAVQETAEWNKKMNTERREKRRAYFDMQTFAVHHPLNGKGRMRVIEKPKLGHYPIALIPGQFTDHFRSYSSNQLKYMPLNTAVKTAPKRPQAFHMAMATAKINAAKRARMTARAGKRPRSDGSSSDSSSSDSSSDDSSDDENEISSASESSSDESDVGVLDQPPPEKKAKIVPAQKELVSKATKKIDADIPGATCKNCGGDRKRNKLGQPEVLLHCSKCDSSSHPTCVGLNIELLQFVTSYNWECTDCKNCSKCNDHSDEDKMLFCDLCDRGYHSYCVGLDEIPSGRWHCVECSTCSLCGGNDPMGGEKLTDQFEKSLRGKKVDWHFEYKTGSSGGKIYSSTMCIPCHRLWKKTQFCPECNICFGREKAGDRGKDLFDQKTSEVEYAYCWVCSRQHHAKCVGGAPRFICQGCQNRTQSKCVALAGNVTTVSSEISAGANTSFGFGSSFSRSRRSGVVQ